MSESVTWEFVIVLVRTSELIRLLSVMLLSWIVERSHVDLVNSVRVCQQEENSSMTSDLLSIACRRVDEKTKKKTVHTLIMIRSILMN